MARLRVQREGPAKAVSPACSRAQRTQGRKRDPGREIIGWYNACSPYAPSSGETLPTRSAIEAGGQVNNKDIPYRPRASSTEVFPGRKNAQLTKISCNWYASTLVVGCYLGNECLAREPTDGKRIDDQ